MEFDSESPDVALTWRTIAAGDEGPGPSPARAWRGAEAAPLHPRHQCSPLAWDDGLGGLVLHGGEARHGGPQFDATLLLERVAG